MVVTLGMAVPTAAVELHIIFIYPNAKAPPPATRYEAGYRGGRITRVTLLASMMDSQRCRAHVPRSGKVMMRSAHH